MKMPNFLRRGFASAFRPHLLVIGAIAVVCTLLYAPLFRAGLPPGVDTPTFLHYSWFVRETLEGRGGLIDPYWYGGFNFYKSYPPLSYTLVGVLAYVTHLDLALVYKVVLLIAYIGLGVATYWLALELRTGVFASAVAGLLAVMAYPVFTGLGHWGWFTTLVALPLGIASLAALERAVRLRSFRFAALGGCLFGLSILAELMAPFALGLALIAWGVFRLASSPHRTRTLSLVGVFAATTAIVSVWWVVPFELHATETGFRRVIPGNWTFPLWFYLRSLTDVTLIGQIGYPTYAGIVHLALAVGGTALSLLWPSRATPYGVAALVFLAFSVSEQTNPLLRLHPLDGLDVARFLLFLMPFSAVLGAFYLSELWKAAREPVRRFSSKTRMGIVLGALVLVILLALPVYDAVRASQATLKPFRVEQPLQEALEWLKGPDTEPGKVLGVGWWHWHTFLVPSEAGRAVMDGWYDEGTRDWRTILQVRLMMWTANVDVPRLQQIMAERDATYVVVYRYAPIEHPEAVIGALQARPDLFHQVMTWDKVVIFHRLPAQDGQPRRAVAPPASVLLQ